MSAPVPPPAPMVDADSIGFWEAAREGRIALCHCPACDSWLARPMECCPSCGGPTEFRDSPGTGTIYSYIVVHNPSVPAFAHLVPYVVALVEFDEGPRLPGLLLDERGPGVAIGQAVQAEVMDWPGAAEPTVVFRRRST